MLNYSNLPNLQPEPDTEGQRVLDIQTGDGERSGCPSIFFVLSSSGSGFRWRLFFNSSRFTTEDKCFFFTLTTLFSLCRPCDSGGDGEASITRASAGHSFSLQSGLMDAASWLIYTPHHWFAISGVVCKWCHKADTSTVSGPKVEPLMSLWEKPPQETHYCLATDFLLMTMTWYFFLMDILFCSHVTWMVTLRASHLRRSLWVGPVGPEFVWWPISYRQSWMKVHLPAGHLLLLLLLISVDKWERADFWSIISISDGQ